MKIKNNITHIIHSELGGVASVVFAINNLDKNTIKERIILCGPKLNKNYYEYLKKKK